MLTAAGRDDLVRTVEVFHSKIPDSRQEEIANDLLDHTGRIKIVIATSALSMGFDAVGNTASVK